MNRRGNKSEWRPLFVREIRERAESDGILQATYDLLKRDNVTINTSGHVKAVRGHSGGMLFIGNHEHQLEFVALMAVLGDMGRTSMKNIVKFYVQNQIAWGLGKVGLDITLPVYPRLLDKDRKNRLNLELGSRVLFGKSLKEAKEARRLTADSLAAASEELSQGGIVNVFPTGRICNTLKRPWHRGTGQIVQMVPEASRDDVLIVPYCVSGIRRMRLLGAIAARGRGPLGRPQNINITFGQPHTAVQIVGMLPLESGPEPDAITELLRQQYAADFTSGQTSKIGA